VNVGSTQAATARLAPERLRDVLAMTGELQSEISLAIRLRLGFTGRKYGGIRPISFIASCNFVSSFRFDDALRDVITRLC